jgi:gliding motility-associated-like protein
MEIDKLFKQKLASREVDANTNLFNKIESKLDASAAGNATTSSTQVATSVLTTSAKVTLISIAAAAVAIGGYFIAENQNQDTAKPTDKEVVAEQKVANDVEKTTIADNNVVAKTTEDNVAKADDAAVTTDFSDMIATPNNSNIEIEFNQPQKSNTASTLHNYKPTIERAAAKDDVEEVATANSPMPTSINKSKQTEKAALSSKLRIPNYITPNDDGINDHFVIDNLSLYPDNVLIIWNRAGKQIFSASHYQNNWNAQNLPSGTYMYKLLLKTEDESEVKAGIIEVMR